MVKKRLPKTICGSPDQPLRIAGTEIECYVLDDNRRVLSFGGIQKAVGLADGGSMTAGRNRLEDFAKRQRIRQFVSEEILGKLASPFLIKVESVQKYALEAEVLPALCEAVIAAGAHGLLQPQQWEIAHRCEVLHGALSRVGIVALVDEASGYQKLRDEQELQRILDAYVLPEHRPHVTVVPAEFTKEVCRVHGWKYSPDNRLPRYVGKFLRQVIYKQLPRPVLPALDHTNPADDNWQRRRKHHQYITDGIGVSHFKTQLAGIMALLRASHSKEMFWELFDRAYGGQLAFNFPTGDRK